MRPARLRALLVALCLLCLVGLPPLVGGCGFGREKQFGPSAPSSCGDSRFRPNYCGDLNGTNYFTESTITYRIVQPGRATDIHDEPIRSVKPSSVQAQDIRDGFAKWQTALAENDPAHRRVFVELAEDDPATAGIDVVVQARDDFAPSSIDDYGHTATALRDHLAGYVRRSVIRIRSDLAERTFRHIALHEDGHGLGMVGHSRRVGTVMYPIVAPSPVIPPVELTGDDKRTIQAIYTR